MKNTNNIGVSPYPSIYGVTSHLCTVGIFILKRLSKRMADKGNKIKINLFLIFRGVFNRNHLKIH